MWLGIPFVPAPSCLRLSPRLFFIFQAKSVALMSWTLPPTLFELPVSNNPNVGGDARIVEELIGQPDDGFQHVVLDYPTANVTSPLPASPVKRGEPLKTIAIREPSPPPSGAG